MEQFETSTTIDASPDRVWEVLTDTSRWPDWDSGVVSVDGELEPGKRIKVVSELNLERAYPVKVAELEPGRRMTWRGGMPLGLFRAVRTYRLSPDGHGRTRFEMREEFSGPLLPLIWRSMPDMDPSFRQFAEGLRRRVEGAG